MAEAAAAALSAVVAEPAECSKETSTFPGEHRRSQSEAAGKGCPHTLLLVEAVTDIKVVCQRSVNTKSPVEVVVAHTRLLTRGAKEWVFPAAVRVDTGLALTQRVLVRVHTGMPGVLQPARLPLGTAAVAAAVPGLLVGRRQVPRVAVVVRGRLLLLPAHL